MEGIYAFEFIINCFKLIFIVVAMIILVIVCISIERTKNESIRSREILENINKIEIARYKKEFNIQDKTENISEQTENVKFEGIKTGL